MKKHPLERRQFGRRAAWKPARVHLESGAVIDCVVIDESDGGVAIQVDENGVLPEEFDLTVLQDDIIVRCKLIHRTGRRVGLRFVQSPRIASRVYKTGSKAAKKVQRKTEDTKKT